MKTQSRYRWFVVAVFFVFMLLHQCDKLLIGPLTTPIMKEFGINRAQMGFITTGALIIGAIFYPLWGYLYDRYARAKLLALASLIWGGRPGSAQSRRHIPPSWQPAPRPASMIPATPVCIA